MARKRSDPAAKSIGDQSGGRGQIDDDDAAAATPMPPDTKTPIEMKIPHTAPGASSELDSTPGQEEKLAVLGTSEGTAALFYTIIEKIIFDCEVDFDGKPRPEQAIRKLLLAEARRFERGDNWRGENLALSQMAAAELRGRVARRIKRSSGRPRELGIARPLLEHIIQDLRTGLQARGRGDLADKILDPGQAPSEWDGSAAKPTGLSTVVGIATVLAELAKVELPPQSLERAASDIRRNQRRKRQKASKTP